MSATPVNVRRQLLWGTALVAGLLLVLAAGSWLNHGGDASSVDVEVECRAHVREQLKAPSTAAFTGERAARQQDGTWRVTGSVDSQNSFGAMIRGRYVCLAKDDGSVISVDVS